MGEGKGKGEEENNTGERKKVKQALRAVRVYIEHDGGRVKTAGISSRIWRNERIETVPINLEGNG